MEDSSLCEENAEFIGFDEDDILGRWADAIRAVSRGRDVYGATDEVIQCPIKPKKGVEGGKLLGQRKN